MKSFLLMFNWGKSKRGEERGRGEEIGGERRREKGRVGEENKVRNI